MRTRKLFAGIVAVGIGAFLAPSPTLAEVSVQLDPDGRYRNVAFVAVEDGEQFAFWAAAGQSDSVRLLNPDGDRFGDGRPALAEDPDGDRPVVVWSRAAGRTRLLVWSTWEGDGWSPPRWVHTLPAASVDSDPILTVDPDGVLHLAWVRQTGARGRIYWSRFLGDAGWTVPQRLAKGFIDSGSLRLDLEGEWPALLFGPSDHPGRVPLPRPGRSVSGPITQSEVLQDGITDDPDVLP